MNLTGITEYEEVVEKHYVDSLSIVKVMDMDKVDTGDRYWYGGWFSWITA